MFLGSYFFGIIGASLRWVIHLVICIFMGKKPNSFKETWLGTNQDNPESEVSTEILNNVLGVIIIIALGYIFMNKRF
jgi:hypothetical protein